MLSSVPRTSQARRSLDAVTNVAVITARLPAHRVGGGPDRLWAQEDTARGAAGRCSRRVGSRRDWKLAFTSAALAPGPPGWRRSHSAGPQRWLPPVVTLAPCADRDAGNGRAQDWPSARGQPGPGLCPGMRDLECHGPCLTVLAVREVGGRGTRNKLPHAGGTAWVGVSEGLQVDPSPLSGPLRGQGG